MARYYLAATVIVVLVGALLAAHRLGPPDLRIAGRGQGTPSAERPAAAGPRTPPPFRATGSWVLSALPACFDERSRLRGTAIGLAAKIPPDADRIDAPATLIVATCTLHVEPHALWVERGADRMRLPSGAALYRVDGRLTLVVRTGSNVEIRRY